MALPVALPDLRRGVIEGGARDEGVLLAVAHSAIVLAPSHLTSVGGEVGAGDVVVNAHLGPAQAGEERLGLIGAGFIEAVALLVVRAMGLEALVEPIPALGLVGVDDAASLDAGLNGRDRLGFGAEGEREGLALALADDDDDPALAGLVLGKATVATIRLHVLGADVAAEVGAVHLDRARHGGVCGLGGDGLAELMRHHERRPVLAVEVAGELEGGMTLGAVGEDRDGKEMVADRKLAGGEDGAAGDAELVTATGALEELPSGDEGVFEAAAAGADSLAIRGRPADGLEGGPSLVVRHAGDLGEVEGAGRLGEKKVLGHGFTSTFCVDVSSIGSFHPRQRF